jgi:hypothetical protein
MWRKFLRNKELRFGTRMVVTVLAVPDHLSTDASAEHRSNEHRRWYDRVRDRGGREEIVEAAWRGTINRDLDLENELRALYEQITALTRAVAERDIEIGVRRRVVEKSLDNTRSLEERFFPAVEKMTGLQMSMSWRATAPLRFIERIIKNRFGKLAGKLAPGWRTTSDEGSASREDCFVRIIASSGMFDAAWYLRNNPDVARTGMEPIRHFVRYGAAEGRDPSSSFNLRAYVSANPAIAAAGINPLLHYLAIRSVSNLTGEIGNGG